MLLRAFWHDRHDTVDITHTYAIGPIEYRPLSSRKKDRHRWIWASCFEPGLKEFDGTELHNIMGPEANMANKRWWWIPPWNFRGRALSGHLNSGRRTEELLLFRCYNFYADFLSVIITARCTIVHSAVLGLLGVRPSVRLWRWSIRTTYVGNPGNWLHRQLA